MDAAAIMLGVGSSKDQWYSVKRSQTLQAGVGGLITLKYGGSLRRALRSIYPEHTWLDWRFGRLDPSWLNNPTNAAQCIEWLGKQLGVHSMEDWYSISLEDVRKHSKTFRFVGGQHLPISAVVALAYPNHPWLPWKFRTGVPDGFWMRMENQRLFCDWASKQLGINSDSDWLRITSSDFLPLGGYTLINNYYLGSIQALVRAVYPTRNWDEIMA